MLDSGIDGFLNAALDADGVGAAGHVLQAFAIDRLGEDGGGGGAVARGVARFTGDFADHLGAHVFIGIFQFYLLGDGDAVLGHGRGAIFLVEDDVAAFGAEGRDDGLREFLHTPEQSLTSCLVE